MVAKRVRRIGASLVCSSRFAIKLPRKIGAWGYHIYGDFILHFIERVFSELVVVCWRSHFVF